MKIKFLLLAALTVLLVPGAVLADTVADFSVGPLHDLGVSSITVNGVTATGWYDNVGTWQLADLYRRTGLNDNGIGVCNPNEIASGACSANNGDANELDNMGNNEMIGLTLPHGYKWVSVQVSSLDTNGTVHPIPEMGILYTETNTDPNSGVFNPIVYYAGGVNEQPIFPLAGADQYAHALFFFPVDWLNGTSLNNDHLVYTAVIRQVPEPATFFLLGAGLAALALKLRKN